MKDLEAHRLYVDNEEIRRVYVQSNDSGYQAWLLASFSKRDGKILCIIEDINGQLSICDASQLTVLDS